MTRLRTSPALLLAWSAAAANAAAAQSAGVEGTYEIWLCRVACPVADTATAPVAGYLVLSEDTLSRGPITPDAWAEMLDESSFLLIDRRSYRQLAPNACFALRSRTAQVSLLAGIIPFGLTRWSSEGDKIQVQLYASPDAFYTLTAQVSGDRLLGGSREYGFIGEAFDQQLGPVHGRRIGPPDVGRCGPGATRGGDGTPLRPG